ncbi:fimbrillin family protein [Segatella copri]|uniref:fimbrillin family protein n=1 Tax=Segatella copri TaxID=165179 RepID=UPI002230FC86|nr:fimbrillin family protein [Segatella copri]MCW4085021.1 fimbrillin family protein [Segatella copri]MCW4159900.1 fimbrillin family protein [Segatella copri]
MDKKFVMGIAAMAALTLVSCSSDDLDSVSGNSSKNEAISFDSYLGRSAVAVNGSRGSELNNTTLQSKGFGVFGNYSTETTTAYGNNLFDNQPVTYDKAKSKWTYSPLKFWPSDGHIDFLAYAPYEVGKKLENTTIFGFTVDEDIAKQKDLVWSNATGKITANVTSPKEKVKFKFKHALSRLGYTVKLSGNYSSNNVTFTLKDITLAGSADGNTPAFYKTGTINLATQITPTVTDPWTSKDNTTKLKFNWFHGNYNIPEPKAGTTEPSSYHPNKDDKGNRDQNEDYLFVIPQNFLDADGNGDKLYVIVEYDITYNNDPKTTITNKVYKQIKQDFKRGTAYKLNLTLGLPIEFDVTAGVDAGVEGWGDEENINIGSNDKNPWDRE